MPASDLTSRILPTAAKLRITASSVAAVASGYELSLCPCVARFSQWQNVVCSGGDR